MNIIKKIYLLAPFLLLVNCYQVGEESNLDENIASGSQYLGEMMNKESNNKTVEKNQGEISSSYLEIIQKFPGDNSIGIALDGVIGVKFNSPIDQATLNNNSFIIKNAKIGEVVEGDIVLSADGGIWKPKVGKQLEPNTMYLIEVTTEVTSKPEEVQEPSQTSIEENIPQTGIVVTKSKKLKAPAVWSIQTGSTATVAGSPPKIVQTNPENKDENVLSDTEISISFDRPMNQESADTYIELIQGTETSVPFTLETSPYAFTLILDPPLQFGFTYTIKVDKNLTDIHENKLDSDYRFSFSTQKTDSLFVIEKYYPDNNVGKTFGKNDDQIFSIWFSEPVDPSVLDADHFRLRSMGNFPIEGSLQRLNGGRLINFIPKEEMVAGNSGNMLLNNIKSIYGNTIPQFRFTFYVALSLLWKENYTRKISRIYPETDSHYVPIYSRIIIIAYAGIDIMSATKENVKLLNVTDNIEVDIKIAYHPTTSGQLFIHPVSGSLEYNKEYRITLENIVGRDSVPFENMEKNFSTERLVAKSFGQAKEHNFSVLRDVPTGNNVHYWRNAGEAARKLAPILEKENIHFKKIAFNLSDGFCGIRSDNNKIACLGWLRYKSDIKEGAPSFVDKEYLDIASIREGRFCAIRSADKGIDCWGDYGAIAQWPAAPSGTFQKIRAGRYHFIALQEDGKVKAWGPRPPDGSANSWCLFGECQVPAEVENKTIQQMHTNHHRNLVVDDTGHLHYWGYSAYGMGTDLDNVIVDPEKENQVSLGLYAGLCTIPRGTKNIVCHKGNPDVITTNEYKDYPEMMNLNQPPEWIQGKALFLTAGYYTVCAAISETTEVGDMDAFDVVCWGDRPYRW